MIAEQISCSNSKCLNLNEKITQFKSCHYCYTFYCSKKCRQIDWNKHKNYCYYGQLASICKKVLIKVGRDHSFRNEISKLAQTCYTNMKNNGFIWLDFNSQNEAEEFIIKPLNIMPKYVLIESDLTLKKNMILSQLFGFINNDETNEDLNEFLNLINSYDSSKEFILLTSIKIDQNKINYNALYKPKRNCLTYQLKFLKMSLKIDESSYSISSVETNDCSPLTLVLTSLKKDELSNKLELDEQNDSQESRELFLANLLNEFQARGINMRQKFPKIYRDLCLYVEENRPFTPVCLFPRDMFKNNLFMCLIMPNSEPINFNEWFNEDRLNEDYDLVESSIKFKKKF